MTTSPVQSARHERQAVATRPRQVVVVGVVAGASGRAVAWAQQEADSAGRQLHLVHAWSTPVRLGQGGGDDVLPSRADCALAAETFVESALAEATDRRGPHRLDVIADAQEGEPGRVLVRASADATVLVVGRRRRGRFAGTLLGSASSYVLRHAECPLLLVPEARETADPQSSFERVVVGLDGVGSSHSALLWAADAARRHNRPLVVVHAWTTRPPRASAVASAAPTDDSQQIAEQARLVREVDVLLENPPGVLRTEARHGDAARVLLDEAGEADLLVVGSRHSEGLASLLPGSVATQCAHFSRGAVAVVRDGQERLD